MANNKPVTVKLNPKASIDTKTAYCGFAYHMRNEFKARCEAEQTDKNLEAFAHWDMEYKFTNAEIEPHYTKFDTGALLNLIDNQNTFIV